MQPGEQGNIPTYLICKAWLLYLTKGKESILKSQMTQAKQQIRFKMILNASARPVY